MCVLFFFVIFDLNVAGRRIYRCLMQSAMNFLRDNDPSVATGVLHRMDSGRHHGGCKLVETGEKITPAAVKTATWAAGLKHIGTQLDLFQYVVRFR